MRLAQRRAHAFECSSNVIDRAIQKARFWADHAGTALDERPRKGLPRLPGDGDDSLLDDLNAEQYPAITSTSKATASLDPASAAAAALTSSRHLVFGTAQTGKDLVEQHRRFARTRFEALSRICVEHIGHVRLSRSKLPAHVPVSAPLPGSDALEDAFNCE